MNSFSSFHLLIFVAVTIILVSLKPTEAASCHPDDEAGLFAFKSGITKDPAGLLKTWKKSTYCCSWDGINCRFDNRVTSLSVSGPDYGKTSFTGIISPSLAKLQHLETIQFRNLKNMTGSFPQLLFKLPLLTSVYLQNSRLSGPLPTNIGELSHLEVLSIEGNRFTGPIPSSISNMTELKALRMGGNLLTGTIPLEIANLKHVWDLDLSENRLYGTIPKRFKSMKELLQIMLSGNKFSEQLSKLIASLPPNLMHLKLGHNNISGSIPSSISKLEKLQTLDLSNNQLSGAVPKRLAKLVELYDLNLSHNFLTDPFRVFHTNKTFSSLDLSYNRFKMGTIPKWTTMEKNMCTLKLANCGIKTSLDDWKPLEFFCDISIDLSDNDISGSPAKLFEGLSNLYEFRASGNKLKFDMQKLNFSKMLATLDLSRNLVFGTVPTTVARLKTLNLSQNHLCGKLPPTKFSASVFAGNDCLCGSPLAPCKS